VCVWRGGRWGHVVLPAVPWTGAIATDKTICNKQVTEKRTDRNDDSSK
jgi:hypothetical protein